MAKKITEFVKDLNTAFEKDGVDTRVKVNELHKWLKKNGFVENKKDKRGETYKHVTKTGKELGIRNYTKEYGDKTIVFVRKAKDIIKDKIIETGISE